LNRPYISRKPKPKYRNFNREEKKIVIQEVLIEGPISIKDLANAINVKTKDVIRFVNKIEKKRYNETQMLNPDLSELIVLEYGHKPILKTFRTIDSLIFERIKNNKNLQKKPPVVTIMGHVDHGKTSLLDAFRSSNVVDQESGGITQHIGAYQIVTKSGEKISFIDTPGHEAFTEMRARGSKVTDIVILVVAADDGIMPQTIESINHIHAAGVPMIVAINKIDRTNGDVTSILNQLIQYEVIAEQCGGEVMAIPISAKNKTNIDKLEEAILLQAEMLELQADFGNKATGVVIESKINNVKGCCATLLVQNGSLNVGDCLITNDKFCKVRSMLNEHGQTVKTAEPSIAVEVFGFQSTPEVGQKFIVLGSEREAKDVLKEFEEIEEKQKNLTEIQKTKVFDINNIIASSNENESIQDLKFIIKADVSGTIDAVKYSIDKLNSDKLRVSVIHSATGAITDSDVALAKTTGAIIAGFKISVPSNISSMVQKEGITIRIYDIIYQLIDDVKNMIENKLRPQKIEKYLGKLIVKQIFDIGGTGKIAGCLVDDGLIATNNLLRIKRAGKVVKEEVKVSILKRFKENVKEVKQGLECGLACADFTDIMQGDIIETYMIVENKS
jgi:translation initiation factor IF-2